MKFILFLMLFVAPPAEGPKAESDRAWALQSTSTLEFVTQEACNAAGNAITTSLGNVNTMTVRGWCFCESTVAEKKCPAPAIAKAADALRAQHMNVPNDVSIGVQTLRPPALK